MLNRNQCKLIIKGYSVYWDAYLGCKSEKERQTMSPVLKDLKIEFDNAVRALADMDRLTGGENA